MIATTAPRSDNSITALLVQLSAGNRDAEAQLVPRVYHELRRLAARYMRRERGEHTLQPTALVHEAYVQLVKQPRVPWQSRAHFYAAASQIMRNILVDHARRKRAAKNGGPRRQVTLTDAVLHPEIRPENRAADNRTAEDRTIDVLVLNEALDALAILDARQARIVELHFFGGLSFDEIAEVLAVSERTAKRDWAMARAWLKAELSKQP
jgi:RNA polymerase sigma factor (TIGR02999 family)